MTPPDPTSDMSQAEVGTAVGRFLDQDGNPAANMLVKACGKTTCPLGASGFTDAMGHFTLDAGLLLSEAPRLTSAEGLHFVAMLSPMTGLPNIDFRTITTIRFDEPALGAQLAAGQHIEHNDVALELAGDVSFDIDSTIFLDADAQRFRAHLFQPTNLVLSAVDNALNLELLIATTPVDTLICPAAQLSFPNAAGWAARSSVEVFAHGQRDFWPYAPYCGWAKVSDATVSAHGLRVSTTVDGGLGQLDLIGARLAP